MARHHDDLRQPPLRVLLIAAVAAGAVAGYGTAAAPQTVVVGGSGQTAVAVHMGALDSIGAPYGRAALLDPPGTAPRSVFLLDGLPPAITTSAAATLTAPAASEPLAALTLERAASLPVPEPLPAVVIEPAPPPPPEAAPEPDASLTFEPPPPPEPEPLPEPAVVTVLELPELEPAAAPEPEPDPIVAALPAAETAAPADLLRIEFDGDSADLPGGADNDLRAIADRLLQDEALRAQVKAYAGGSSGSASAARRLSLSRALAVRSVLIEQGVRSTRIDVRALGDRNEGGPPERVDVTLVSR